MTEVKYKCKSISVKILEFKTREKKVRNKRRNNEGYSLDRMKMTV